VESELINGQIREREKVMSYRLVNVVANPNWEQKNEGRAWGAGRSIEGPSQGKKYYSEAENHDRLSINHRERRGSRGVKRKCRRSPGQERGSSGRKKETANAT